MRDGHRNTIAAIVPALNAAKMLPACLSAIHGSALPVDELILFDDGSTDDTAAVATSLGARVIRNAGLPLGPGEGRNRAAAETQCDLLMFVDADVVLHRDALTYLAKALDEPGVVAAFGSYDDRPPSRGVPSQYANLRHHFVHQHGPAYASTFWAGAGVVRRDAFLAAGGFDRAFGRPSIEDIELGVRLIERGGLIRLVPQAQATHLKDWRLLQLWRTDIFQRAIPWSRLIGESRSVGNDLNGSAAERIAAVLAHLVLVGLAGALLTPWFLIPAAAAGAGYLLHNRRFIRFLGARMGPGALAGAVALHWLYHIYASLIFVTVVTHTRLSRSS